jgi:hypothetical protein
MRRAFFVSRHSPPQVAAKLNLFDLKFFQWKNESTDRREANPDEVTKPHSIKVWGFFCFLTVSCKNQSAGIN